MNPQKIINKLIGWVFPNVAWDLTKCIPSFISSMLPTLIYDNLTIEEDDSIELENETVLCVLVKNGDKPIYECVVKPEKLEYREQSDRIWTDAPGGFERKAMKWDVGYNPSEGKIDIGVGEKKKLEIAVGQMWGNLRLSHLDGYSNIECSKEGEYHVTLRIDAKLLVRKTKKPIKVRKYVVEFYYKAFDNMRLIGIKNCNLDVK